MLLTKPPALANFKILAMCEYTWLFSISIDNDYKSSGISLISYFISLIS